VIEKEFSKLLPLLEKKRDEVLAKEKWKKIDLSKPFVVMPYTKYVKRIVQTLCSYGMKIMTICDNNTKLHGMTVDSIRITAVEHVQNLDPYTQMIILSTNPLTVGQIVEQLLSLNIVQNNIFVFEELLSSVTNDLRIDLHRQVLDFLNLTPDFDDQQEIQNATLNILKLMSELRDEHSIDVLLSILTARYYKDFRLLSHIVNKTQYFAGFFPIRENEVFIDAGAFIGDTAIDFVSRTGGEYIIHSFEPNPVIYKKLQNAVSGNERIICHQVGLGNKSEELSFTTSTGGDGKVVATGDVKVQIITGDSLNLAPTWIKADVEGSEMALLQGFQRTIKQYKPRLSICVYHNSYDLWEIPQYIKSLVPDYQFMLLHRCKSWAETVLFAALPEDYS